MSHGDYLVGFFSMLWQIPIISSFRQILDFYLSSFISFTVPQRDISQILSLCLLNYVPAPLGWISSFDFV